LVRKTEVIILDGRLPQCVTLEVLDQYAGVVFRNPQPFTIESLQRVLSPRGFTVPPSPQSGFVISIGPLIVATRADSRVVYEPDVAVLMSNSQSLDRMLETFQLLREVLETELLPRWTEMLLGAEFSLVARVTTEAYPLEVVSRFGRSLDLRRFSDLLGEEAALFSLRVVPARTAHTRENLKTVSDYYELTIEPQVVNPLSYLCRLFYRNHDPTRTTDFAARSHDTLVRAVELVEE